MRGPRAASWVKKVGVWLAASLVAHVVVMASAQRWWRTANRVIPDEVEVEWVEVAVPQAAVELPILAPPQPASPPTDDAGEVARREVQAPKKRAPAVEAPPPPEAVRAPPPPPPQIAVVPPPPTPLLLPPPPPAPAPRLDRHKAVEVDDDEHVVDEAPADAEYWSDKNRRVKEQTRATDTNLERFQNGKSAASEKSDLESEEVGGEKERIAQLEEAQASSLDAKRELASVHNGRSHHAEGVRAGDKGEGGRNGGGRTGKAGALSMRNIEGRGAPGEEGMTALRQPAGGDDSTLARLAHEPDGPDGRRGRSGDPGRPGRPGPKLVLESSDYERIVGSDRARDEAEVARRATSHKQGRWEKKLAGIRASLENFTPEVKPGNQTALGTRAHPFALYLAKMHRQIHELWGFGFLADLDSKSPTHPLNDRNLEVTMEIVLLDDGAVDKVTIVRPSGNLPFDVAAIDTVMSAGPYGAPPVAIHSGDGKVYLHWTFHRNEYQCSNQFADPFILDNASPAADGVARGLPGLGAGGLARPERLRRSKMADGAKVGHVLRAGGPEVDPVAAARAMANLPVPDDPGAEAAALAWANAFEKGDVAGLGAVSGAPFRSGGQVVASDAAGIASLWRSVLAEAKARRVGPWKLLSAAGYRATFGHLPAGVEDGTPTLYLAAKVGDELLTLAVTQDGAGAYRIVSIER